MLYYCAPPCIRSVPTLHGVYFSSSYTTIGVGAYCFGIFLGTGDGVVWLIGIFTLVYAVVMGGFLDVLFFINFILVCSVSLWEDLCGVAF